ncbi:MAG: HAD-IC family P-type ATPase [Bacteroidales bacterium]|jgi:magnesium-transporting ATPase (P-type)|nr:HAD-IC family P-type ATPase [Bacteroidales bacterium]
MNKELVPDAEHKPTIRKEKWYSLELMNLFEKLDSSVDGLKNGEAKERLNFYGENTLPPGRQITLFKIILHQLINPLIFILLAAAVASITIGEAKDAAFIFLVILINSGLGAYQEYNAEKSAQSLQKLLKINARVRRNQEEQDIDSRELVPGDIVLLESGLKVPADMRLIETSNLTVDESFLTGESIAAKKEPGILKKETRVSERTNMAYAGATVMSGRALGIVVSTGVHTQVGQIARDVAESDSAKPPLVLRMEKFTRQISYAVVALSVFLAIILRMNGMDLAAIFFFVVALAVSAIPEGLPVALTVALSIATKRMARRNVIVRKLNAVESLGSCTIIASDKTGTLTVNQQTAKKITFPNGSEFTLSGEGYNGDGKVFGNDQEITYGQLPEIDRIAEVAMMANEATLKKEKDHWHHYGDAMDIALLGMSYKLGVTPEDIRKGYTFKDKIPYESERKFSAAFYEKNDAVRICVKGAVETILGFCDAINQGDNTSALDKPEILHQAEELAEKGYRVLAFASGEFPDFKKQEAYEDKDIPRLTFHGLISFIDPLRKEALDSVEKCKKAGIKVIMITGDHPATAGTIARDLGIMEEDEPVITGQMLEDACPVDCPAFKKLVLSGKVFARISPSQKQEIVDVLIRNGEFVAVTGDGVNDAPALKRANIGVAMGSGTDVAKEVGQMIVIDDNFSSIVAGVEEGRFAYDNVRKVIYLLISTGAAEVILFIASIFAGLPLPLLAVQLLWLNLVTNGIQDVALAFEGGEPLAMKRKPRNPGERIFNPLMITQTIIAGLTMGGIVFGVWFWLINYLQMNEIHARNMVLLLMVFMQNFHAFNARSETTSVFRVPLKRNLILVFGILAAQLIHIASMQIPFMQNILRTEPITMAEWAQILVFAVPMILVMEIFKWINRRVSKA